LQWVLTHSRSAKLLAVHRVTTNRGAKTPGVDNVRWRTEKIWRWITRRHPRKSQAWKKRKYFSAAGDPGPFSVRIHSKKGKSRVLTLYRMASTTIERHIKVRGTANPYDPRYTQYFAQRRCFAWRIRGTGRTTPRGAATPA
jgi:RNA-directed DNA polymerase